MGKYVELPDAYKSIAESFIHSGAMNECEINVEYIHSEDITENNVIDKLSGLNGIPGSTWVRIKGIEGKILTANYASGETIFLFSEFV